MYASMGIPGQVGRATAGHLPARGRAVRTGPRPVMLDGFESGWIDFAGDAVEHLRGVNPPGWMVDALVSAGRGVVESAA